MKFGGLKGFQILALLSLLSACGANVSGSFLSAVGSGKAGRVESFLLEGAPVNAIDERGRTALMLAAAQGHLAIIQLLLKVEQVGEVRTDAEGWTALMYACANGHLRVCDSLLEGGEPINGVSKFGNSALMWAVRNGHDEVVAWLLEKGADPNLENQLGWNALFIARRFEQPSLVRLLTEAEELRP